LTLAAAVLFAWPAAAADHRIGGGFHYWKTIDDLEDEGFDEIDDSGLATVLSYQYVPGGLIKFELDLEYFEDGFGGSLEATYSPQAYIVVGSFVYGALGAGVLVSNGLEDEVSDPFFAAKLGIDMLLLPKLHLDINANYRFDDWNQLNEAETDTVTLAALVRISF
jgi:hypothetical protein